MEHIDAEYWSDKQVVEKFSTKSCNAFFKSEQYFLNQIAGKFNTVLDVGCGSGRLQEILGNYTDYYNYTGVDISKPMLDQGRAQYKDAKFEQIDILNYLPKDRFDLVYAIGLTQHVPNIEVIIDRFWTLSGRYILFDFKSSATGLVVSDKEQAYCARNGVSVYFVLVDAGKLINNLHSRGAKSIMMWSYKTPLNAYTHVPAGCGAIHSTTVLVEIPQNPARIGS